MTKNNALLGASIVAMAIVITVGAMGSAALAVPAPQETQTFRATAQRTGAVGPSGQTTVLISISRWSSDEERNELATVLVDQGSNALADALNKQEEVGFIRFPALQTQFPSVRLRYAREFRQGDERIIILGTDRALGWVESGTSVIPPSRNSTISSSVSSSPASHRTRPLFSLMISLAR